MNRRQFLAATSAAIFVPFTTRAAPQFDLIAQPIMVQILPDAPETPMFGFNDGTPGPELRIRQNDFLDVRFLNWIDQGSAVHWHGLRHDNAMDGVPGLTQDVVPTGGAFSYRVHAPDAGTFWYHSHNRSSEQVAKGLYGALIVDEEISPDVDHDLTVMIDDWRLTDTGALADGFNRPHDQAHQGRLGNFARALISRDVTVRRGDRLRLRLINVATDRIFRIDFRGITGKIVALDGMPLTTPRDIGDLVLAPAQRIDVMMDVVAHDKVEIHFPTADGPFHLGEISVNGDNTDRVASGISALPKNNMPIPNLYSPIMAVLTMQGGAMNSHAMTGTGIWAFNGVSGLADTPFHAFERGQTARIRLVNDTRFAHGIHLHGHHFFETDANGGLGDFRDTTLVQPGETRDIVCVFDNPGKWLLHCHMLGHQAAGMKTWVTVA